ncbi:hypothetical protein K2173_008349 [Erythroxylum novogranatense]|uniref:SHSP domain-containing protein n=1 Tax=Erythroxylum novogranatense TaxID=1862640 RepID=A0AAV8TIW8_9ROSI|nr:hypothetical protein K2173_008349 [Erythroxylum novogranatense]
MDSRTKVAAPDRVYESFEPSMEWTPEPEADTLKVYLPGFKKEQLKVQVTTAKTLRLIGERPVDGKKWSKFRKEVPISSNYDFSGITAKFEKGILSVRHPKVIVNEQAPSLEKPQAEMGTQPPPEAPSQQKPTKPDVKPPQEKPRPPTEGPKPPVEKVSASAQPPKPQDKVQPPLIPAPTDASKPEQKPSEEPGNNRVKSSSLEQERLCDSSKEKKSSGKIPSATEEYAKDDSNKNYRDLLKGLKKPGKYFNLLLVILFLAAFALHAFKSLRSSHDHDHAPIHKTI